MTEQLREIRYAIRRLRAAPVFTVGSIVILALTLGVGTALFSVINSIFLRPLPFEERPGLVRVAWSEHGREIPGVPLPPAIVSQLLFSGDFTTVQLGGHGRTDLAVSIAGNARVVQAEVIAGSYFQIVEAAAIAGRLITPEDSDAVAPLVAVISERLWRASRLAGEDPLNRPIVVAGQPAIVIGVVAAPFHGFAPRPLTTDLWLPAVRSKVMSAGVPGVRWSPDQPLRFAFGRLRGHTTAAQADAETRARVSAVGANDGGSVGVREGLLGPLPVAAYFVGVVTLALCAVLVLVAGASVTNLFLARTSSRRAEIAVRLMLGARPWDIRRLASLEVLLIAVSAGALSIASAIVGVRLVVDLLVRSDSFVLNLQPDWRIFTYAALATLVTMTIVSRIIAGHASQIDSLSTVSATAGLGGSTFEGDLTRKRLLAVQVGGSTLLLILAALLIRSAASGLSYPSGFDPAGAAIGWIDHPSHGHDAERARTVERRILEVGPATAGGGSIALTSALPLDRGGQIVDVLADSGSRPVRAGMIGATTAFFAVFGLELLRGRDFFDNEVAAQMPVAVLSEAAATSLWPKGDAIGRTFRVPPFAWPKPERSDPDTYTVIGVVANAAEASGNTRTADNRIVYVPIGRRNPVRVALLARTRASSGGSLQLLRAAVAASDGNLALQKLSTLEDAIALSRSERRTSGLLLTAIGILAAGIALAGIYGLTAHSVNLRQREFGVLIALGATTTALFFKLMTETSRTLARGAAYGIAASVPCAFLLRRYIWDLQPFDWLVAIAVPVVLIAVGLGAAGLPLRFVVRRSVTYLLRTT
jgi:predicted permease